MQSVRTSSPHVNEKGSILFYSVCLFVCFFEHNLPRKMYKMCVKLDSLYLADMLIRSVREKTMKELTTWRGVADTKHREVQNLTPQLTQRCSYLQEVLENLQGIQVCEKKAGAGGIESNLNIIPLAFIILFSPF